MRLSECELGDYVVVDDGGETIYLELGALLGSKAKTAMPWAALVSSVDPETLVLATCEDWRAVPCELEVLGTVETAKERRMKRESDRLAGWRRRGIEAEAVHGGETDPMLMIRRSGW